MPVTLSPLAGAAQQFFDNNGNPLSGGKLWSYQAGTTTPQTTYTDSAGAVAHTNPIILDSAGRVPTGEIWLTVNQTYKFVLMTSADVTLATWDNITGSSNIALADYSPDLTSLLYPGPLTVKSALDQITNRTTGSSLIGFLPSGTGAVARTAQSKLREVVSVFDFMTSAQIADVQAGTALVDVTAAIQAAIHYAATRALVGGTVYMPPGKYRTSSTITTAGAGNVGQVALVGAGIYATTFVPNGDFTVLNIVTSLMTSGEFVIEWPTTNSSVIPATRIGVELASANYQFSNATLRSVQVRNAYRGFVLNDWTGQPLGTTWLASLEKCQTIRCADWGIYINSKTGSTTLRLMQCYVRADNGVGGAQYGKGIYINNVNEILFEQCAIDQCLDQWMYLVNYNVAVFNSIAFEGNRMASASAVAIQLNGPQNVINGFKDIVNTYDTGGNARIIYMGGNVDTLSICGYSEQGATIAGGTTVYRITFNSATSLLSVLDRSVVPSQVLNNGWVVNAVYEGRRLSMNGLPPSYGTWVRGDRVQNGTPAVGASKGWYCTVSGSPGTWVSEGNL